MLTLSALTAGAILAIGWLLYPVALAVAARRFDPDARAPEGGDATPDSGPPVATVVIATRDAPAVIHARLANLVETDYPADRLAIIVAVDAAGDHPLEAYASPAGMSGLAQFLRGDPPGGKAATLNAAMRAVRTDFILFTDSAQVFEPSTVRTLIAALRLPGVGGVTGEIVTDAERGVFGVFWRYERRLRALESRRGRVVAVTGAVHALRRECWRALPAGLICDDLLIPLRTARMGLAVVATSGARARDPRRFSREEQLDRKVRTLTGMLQVCLWEPWVLLPWSNRIWASFLCHKLIRIATPWLVLFLLVAGAVALPTGIVLTLAAAAAAVSALMLVLLRVSPRRAAREGFWALRLLAAPLIATGNALRGHWGVWRTHATPAPKAPSVS